jgi:hypothetical protein
MRRLILAILTAALVAAVGASTAIAQVRANPVLACVSGSSFTVTGYDGNGYYGPHTFCHEGEPATSASCPADYKVRASPDGSYTCAFRRACAGSLASVRHRGSWPMGL